MARKAGVQLASNSSDTASAVGVDASGRIVVAGGSSYYQAASSPVNAMAVVRLLADGSFDPAFGNGGAVLLIDAGDARRSSSMPSSAS